MPADNPYTSLVGLYLANNSSAFPDAALWWKDQRPGRVVLFSVKSQNDLLEPAEMFDAGEVGQLAIFAHGTPTGVGRPGKWGIDVRPVRWDEARFGGRFISPSDFAEVWAPKLDQQGNDPIVSLAACLCSRSPKWYRVQLWGKDISAWGPKAYLPGGQNSLSAQLCAAFRSAGARVRVRGHCAAGHTIYQALVREHVPGKPVGQSLFSLATPPATQPTLALRNKWQRGAKGELAARYLLNVNESSAMVDLRALMVS